MASRSEYVRLLAAYPSRQMRETVARNRALGMLADLGRDEMDLFWEEVEQQDILTRQQIFRISQQVPTAFSLSDYQKRSPRKPKGKFGPKRLIS